MALLNLTNFDEHPEDPLWLVFRFKERGIALEFMDGLKAATIPFEEDQNDGPPHLVGVKTQYREVAVRINYTVTGRHREPFIADRLIRWVLLGFFGLLLLLVVLGMFFGR